MRVITINYADGYSYDKPLLFTAPENFSDQQIEISLQQAADDYVAELGYKDKDSAEYDGWVFGSLLPEIPLRILEKYNIGLLHAEVFNADFDYGFQQE